MIEVKEREDGSFDVFWDENDPVESIMNNWTEDDFIQEIKNYCEQIKNQIKLK